MKLHKVRSRKKPVQAWCLEQHNIWLFAHRSYLYINSTQYLAILNVTNVHYCPAVYVYLNIDIDIYIRNK